MRGEASRGVRGSGQGVVSEVDESAGLSARGTGLEPANLGLGGQRIPFRLFPCVPTWPRESVQPCGAGGAWARTGGTTWVHRLLAGC